MPNQDQLDLWINMTFGQDKIVREILDDRFKEKIRATTQKFADATGKSYNESLPEILTHVQRCLFNMNNDINDVRNIGYMIDSLK